MAAPRAAIHKGRAGGSVSASKIPVTIALPSEMVLSCQRPRPPSTHSVAAQKKVQTASSSTALKPK